MAILLEAFDPNARILEPLRQEARKYPTFEEFSRAFSREIKHGLYWHVTDNPKFDINPATGPRDMSSAAGGTTSPGALMFTSHLEHWVAYYKRKTRPYAALIDLSRVPKEAYRQVNRGFGNEFFLAKAAAQGARVVKVYRVPSALALVKRYSAALPGSDEELQRLWEIARAI